MKSIIRTLVIVTVGLALADALSMASGRIAGGVRYPRTEVPEVCSIEIDFENKYMFCSCVVITAEWIITALHCVYDQRELFGTVTVTSGIQKVQGILTIGFSHQQIAYVKVSPGLVKSTITDFAQFGSTLENYLTNVNKTLLVCGFGQFDHTRQRYVEPQCADMYIKSPDVCNLKTTSNMLCGYWDNKDNNVCVGDYGGALFSKSTDGKQRHNLIGISAYGKNVSPNANCLDGHKVVFYHAAAFGKEVLLNINLFETKYSENTLFPASIIF